MSDDNFLDGVLIEGGVWQTRPIDEVPEIELSKWRVVQIDEDRHFVGWNMTECEGRVSSKIVEYDKDKRRGVTRSGRVYQLVGESGFDPDGLYTWARWCDINKVADFKDVSDEV